MAAINLHSTDMVTVSQLRSVMLGRTFEFGLDGNLRAHHIMLKAQAELEASVEMTVRQRYGIAPDEAAPEVEYVDFWREVGDLKDEAESAARIIRSALLIALFHFWERHSKRWVQRKSYHHETVMSWLKAQGYTPDEASLKDLELAANCAKHGPGRACIDLFARRPELFDQNRIDAFPAFEPGAHNTRGTHNIQIDSETLGIFFEVVSRGGPRVRRSPNPPTSKISS